MAVSMLKELRAAAEDGRPVSADTALGMLHIGADELPEVMAAATAVRKRRFGNTVHLCAIINARSGGCPEDCAYCAQSAHHRARADIFELRPQAEIVKACKEAALLPIDHFGIVTSGPALDSEGVGEVCRTVAGGTPRPGMGWCASLGSLDRGRLLALKKAGLMRFHHNLETAGSFFPHICSTHTYNDRLATVRAVKEAGMEVCSGGILGMGESLEQRVELATALAHERVDSIPLNFLVPIPGTRLEHLEPVEPLDILRCIAMFRMTNPRAEIKVCAGRAHLRSLQSMIFHAGATGMMIGPLLTVAGCDVEHDLQMLKDLQLLPMMLNRRTQRARRIGKKK